MTLAEAIFCGILQGLAEFLPISSSGHLALLHAFFGVESADANLTFDVLLHFGTLLVVFAVYYREIFSLVPAFFTLLGKVFRGNFCFSSYKKEERLVLLLMLATLPLVLGVFIKDSIEWLASFPKVVGASLMLNACLLLLSDHFAGRGKKEEPTVRGAFLIGLFQMAALMPGLSRSGSTISAGIFAGLTRREAVKFSFILSVPAILGANLLHLPDVLAMRLSSEMLTYCLLGTAVAAVVGFLAMKLLLLISERSKFGFFAYYSFAVGALALIFG